MSPDDPGHERGLAVPVATRLVCQACGAVVPLDEIRPYRCRQGEDPDDQDHVLRRRFDANVFKSWADPESTFADPESNPFRKYRRLFYSHEIARLGGISDGGFTRIVDRTDAAIAAVDGKGFRATPCRAEDRLAQAVGLGPGALWVKDETGNVSGSHKARHLMGILLWLEVIRSIRRPEGWAPTLAIASCGNAALAAAVLARAAGRELEVFVPPDAKRSVLDRLEQLGARLTRCPRQSSDPTGDPCYFRFVDAWREGALPFTVQAKRNGMTLEGGCTLAWEMVSTLEAEGTELDHLFIQVGGGALAASCIEGLRDALALGVIDRLPRIHTVQTESAYPLRRAYDLLLETRDDLPRGETVSSLDREGRFDLAFDSRRALRIRDETPRNDLAEALDYAIHHRSGFMWPWETTPRSVAFGILDDETYDWIPVLEGMLETGGVPIVASEAALTEAHRLAHECTTIPVEATGSAGLAGLQALQAAGVVGPGDTVALLFTGVER